MMKALSPVQHGETRERGGNECSPLFPSTVTLLPTYRCTAACENCCFDSNPTVRGRISLDHLMKYVDQAASMRSVRTIVVSGGEPFTLGYDLDAVIERAHNHGLHTRIVTNGYWAVNASTAYIRLQRLVSAGLEEINFSTGDNHLMFVPLDRVALGAQAATHLGMNVVIVVERRRGGRVTVADITAHPAIQAVVESVETRHLLQFIETPWIRRGPAVQGLAVRKVEPGPHVQHDDEMLLTRANLTERRGCDSVLSSLVVTPYEQVGSCCGLAREEVPELNLGSARDKGLKTCAEEARADFMKIWLAIEGPEHILAWAARHDPDIEWEGRYSHQCDACRALYNDSRVREVIQQHYVEKVPDVLLQFAAMERAATSPSGPEAS